MVNRNEGSIPFTRSQPCIHQGFRAILKLGGWRSANDFIVAHRVLQWSNGAVSINSASNGVVRGDFKRSAEIPSAADANAGRHKRTAIDLPKPKRGKGVAEAKANKQREVPFSCPECNGPMFEVRQGKLLYFHCEVGHAFAPGALTDAHTDALERAL